jgi:hypothetical protein
MHPGNFPEAGERSRPFRIMGGRVLLFGRDAEFFLVVAVVWYELTAATGTADIVHFPSNGSALICASAARRMATKKKKTC